MGNSLTVGPLTLPRKACRGHSGEFLPGAAPALLHPARGDRDLSRTLRTGTGQRKAYLCRDVVLPAESSRTARVSGGRRRGLARRRSEGTQAVIVDQGKGAHNAPPICLVLPDGQEVRGRLHARRRAEDGWLYQVGILVWQDATSGPAEPAEQRVWVSPAHARPVPGVSYQHVPTHTGPQADSRSHRRPPAWTIQYLPHRPGHPGATLLHVVGCTPSDRTLTREEALAALDQPRAAACIQCDAARSLTSDAQPTDQPRQAQHTDESHQNTKPRETVT
ncbi:DUF6233 domain-containing protein [Streptomyces sp. NBC_01017]|uniref:DUF6233 domain-containing protein n=1 Tax=Streptomyces sp. NBC_01017 TaxID=2903721 RepID=UPI00386DE7F4